MTDQQAENGVTLTADERRSVGCACTRLDDVWHHQQTCPVPAIEQIVGNRLTAAAPLVRRAMNDPGAFVQRGEDYDGEPYGERLDQWQSRAIEAALVRVISPGGGVAQ